MVPVRARSRSGDASRAVGQPELVVAGRAWLRGRLQPIELGIGDDGSFVSIGRSVAGQRRHDVGDRVLLPSATDLHVHFRDPGAPDEVEDFATGTLQAALGGVGLIGDMPNTRPLLDRPSRLEAKAARTRGRLAVDAALLGSAQRAGRTSTLAGGVAGFKLFLSPTTGVSAAPEGKDLSEILSSVAATSLPLTVHAEDPTLFLPSESVFTSGQWEVSRPISAETRSVATLVAAAPKNLRLNVAHVTNVEALELATKSGHAAEATAHHLLLSAGTSRDPRTKVNPPLRPESERAQLWEAFVRGEVPFLASDHAPHSELAKDQPYALAPSGMPGVETTLPLLLAQVRQSDVALATVQAAACDRPARWLGRPQGRLAVGHSANFLVVDFRQRRTLRARGLHAPCGWTPFEGRTAIFPQEHFLRGERIVEGGEYIGRRSGGLVRPEFVDPRLKPVAPGSEHR